MRKVRDGDGGDGAELELSIHGQVDDGAVCDLVVGMDACCKCDRRG